MNLKIFTEDIEQAALTQIYQLLAQPAFRDAKVRIMPDVHAGAGCVIGFTADLGDKVIPNIVGIDLGCGMHVVKLGHESDLNLDLAALDDFIHKNVPAGFCVNARPQVEFDLKELYCYSELLKPERLILGIGSLGGGNHFIELDKDEDGYIYLVIHTGSRNLGKQVATLYQDKAIAYCNNTWVREANEATEALKAEGRFYEIEATRQSIKAKYHDMAVPDALCYLEGDDRQAYLHDMRLCQRYAVLNRKVIGDKIIAFLGVEPLERWECAHNYIDDQNMIRKGAISAHKGEKVIIPLNMRDGSIIGVGKGNPDWNESGPHGAGRLMSRGAAKRSLSLDEFQETMSGIYSSTVNLSTIDESPMAYKPAQEIVDNIKDTIEITCIIKPIYNFKAGDE